MPSIIRGADDFDSLESQGLGDGQTWQDVSASRSTGVTYTNSTGRPIFIFVNINSTHNSSSVIDGINIINHNARGDITAVVPNGSTYQISSGVGFYNWKELR